jgi:hypothetical protein
LRHDAGAKWHYGWAASSGGAFEVGVGGNCPWMR